MDEKVKEYLEAAPNSRKEALNALHQLILEEFPDAVVDMKYRMPTYCVGEGWVSIANQKHYVSLYTCGYHHIKEFKEKHPGYKTGKGCINFKDKDALPLDDIRRVVQLAILHPKDDAS